MKWNGRVVTDVVGNAGSVVLDEESTAQRDLEDWLHDYYEIDDDEARQYAMSLFGLSVEFDSEWSAEHSAEAIHEYMRGRGEPGTGR